MMKKLLLFSLSFLFAAALFAQENPVNNSPSVFEKITKAVAQYSFDSSEAPKDKITKEINKLRQLRGGFNINEAIEFKLEEDLKNKNLTDSSYRYLKHYFHAGEGKRLLDNAVIWIYRQHFTYRELKQLTKFYRSAAGQKMAAEFPVIMLETLVAGEAVKKLAAVSQ